ncbi:MAG TPA: hypothetical protein VFC90_11680 [Planctomycetota bacterium]|nr:hypothetical protein [Planctomycetota bacterium]
MSLLLLGLLFAQAGDDEKPPPRTHHSGVEAGVVFLHLDSQLGAEDKLVPGIEAAFAFSKSEPKYSIGFRAYYRQWEVTFEEFNQAPADLDGEVQQLGADLVVSYPLPGPLSLVVEVGGGVMRLEHDLDEETTGFFEGGAYLRIDLIAGLYVEAGGAAFAALTEFGGQDDDTNHVSWVGRVSAGLEIDF